MSPATLGGLGVLALIDSTSFGTLDLPVLMLARRKVHRRPYVVFLGVLAVFYFLLGLALLLGAGALVGPLLAYVGEPVLRGAGLVLGLLLLVASLWTWPRTRALLAWPVRQRPRRRDHRGRWIEALTGDGADLRLVAGAALVVGLIEAASMLPYLGAIGIIGAASLPMPAKLAVLAGYVVVMIVPALLLLAARVLLADRVEPVLARVGSWLQRAARPLTAIIFAGAGGYLVATSVPALVA